MKKLFLFVLAVLIIISAASALALSKSSATRCTGAKCLTFKKFKSTKEFTDYINKANEGGSAYPGLMMRATGMAEDVSVGAAKTLSAPTTMSGSSANSQAAPSADRVSRTNVQVAGIDEPDILKTDGSNLYYSPNTRYFYDTIMPTTKMVPTAVAGGGVSADIAIMPPYYRQQPKTTVFTAFPPKDLAIKSTIDDAGPLMLAGKTLVVQAGNRLSGYSVADAANPGQKWSLKFESNQSINTSRLYGSTLYVVAVNWLGGNGSCPMPLYTVGTRVEKLACTDIYYPSVSTAGNAIYSVLAIDPQTGTIKRRIAFIAPSGNTIVYMSEKAVYLAYNYQEDQTRIMLDFLKTDGVGLYSTSVVVKLEKLLSYDISQGSKQSEIYNILNSYFATLTSDEKLRLETETQNRFDAYLKKHQRDVESTGIAKIGLWNMSLLASRVVPGHALNQFALDEYNGYLRIAVTSDQSLWLSGGMSGRGESVSDVYVLDSNLNIASAVKNLGKTERIYGVRFIEDMGYVVTFRQIDPLYVLDLANPRNPKIAGELKIPGYSAYLHPINADTLIGVGRENNKVKISLFDVSNPYAPREIAKYALNEWWTDVESNHHAFLLDRRNKVFFMPGGQGGYIISYAGNNLSLKKAVSGYSVRRAAYLDNYLYVVGDNKITVLDERDWSVTKELNYRGEEPYLIAY
ncbi:MAG: beta-propeller domain-containing protein [bacterium]